MQLLKLAVLPFGLATLLAVMSMACGGQAVSTPTPFTPAITPTPDLEPSPTPRVEPTTSASPTPSLDRGLQTATALTETPPPGTPAGTSTVSATALEDTAFGYITEILDVLGPRESSTDEEREAADYLASQFAGMGYSVELQAFTVESLSLENSGLTLVVPGPEVIEAIPLAKSATGDVTGILAPVGLALEADIPEEGLEGKIALIRRGRITFEQKVVRVANAGAVAAVVYNILPGTFRGALINPGTVPAIAIGREDGERLLQLISKGDVEVTISVVTEERPSQNVIAEKPGSEETTVVLGAHYDTVPNVPGANDNASGTTVLLTLAQELSQTSLPFGLQFIAFGSEELGLVGSQFYVNSLSSGEQKQIRAMLNFDTVGSGNSLGVLGTSELTDIVVAHGSTEGIDVDRSSGLAGGSSDHASFDRVGIPIVFFFSDGFSRIHTPDDTLDSINPTLLADAARLAIRLIGSLAAGPLQTK